MAIREAAREVALALAWRAGDEAPVVRALVAVAPEVEASQA